MSAIKIAEFETKSMGTAEVLRMQEPDERIRKMLYEGAFHPGIVATLGAKDQKRFSPEGFLGWMKKNGGRTVHVALVGGNLAGTIFQGPQGFPKDHFPDSPVEPPYTIAFRSEYSTPDGGTYGGQRIAKNLGLAAMADYAELTRRGGPNGVLPVTETGIWLDTGVDNEAGKGLYRHIGNTSRDQEALGFVDVGVHHPEPIGDPIADEPRVGMVITPATLAEVVAVGRSTIDFSAR
jgi:hypothetical protein